MSFCLSKFKWRLFVLLVSLQVLASMNTLNSHAVDASVFQTLLKRRPFDYKGGHFGSNPNRGFIKGHLRPEEYQYGPDEIPFILYS
ncbi:Uncharacterized protein APZ42_018221 [Daphnia magna]|uniref:Uncharacterized protein n=2 Tax=Daphnia magna TaxID=35525 RepID=A0ABQ9YTU8_9CRUS|nr:hypothetical protein OUZ56_005813 [Daphnia magna]KZS16075.1 Uncharacterized protein APZ42_018221 [Daphnia magna]